MWGKPTFCALVGSLAVKQDTFLFFLLLLASFWSLSKRGLTVDRELPAAFHVIPHFTVIPPFLGPINCDVQLTY